LKTKPLFLLLLVAALAPLSARGRTEEGAGERPLGSLPVFLIFVDGEEPDPLFVERFHLPLAAAAYGWAGFSVREAEVILQEAGGLRILSRRQVSREPAGGLVVVGYALKASGYQADPGPPGEVLTIRFRYSRSSGDGLPVQPARRALLEGIRSAGRSSGFIRLDALEHLGGGRFRARVALR
jgi:hypothetical protein